MCSCLVSALPNSTERLFNTATESGKTINEATAYSRAQAADEAFEKSVAWPRWCNSSKLYSWYCISDCCIISQLPATYLNLIKTRTEVKPCSPSIQPGIPELERQELGPAHSLFAALASATHWLGSRAFPSYSLLDTNSSYPIHLSYLPFEVVSKLIPIPIK